MKPHEFSYKGWVVASGKNVLVNISFPNVEILFSGEFNEQAVANLKHQIDQLSKAKMK